MDQHFNVCSVIFIHLDFHTLILWLCRLLFLLCSRKTGIEFAVDVGCLSVGDRGGNYITAVKDVVEKDHINAQVLSGADVRSQFPFLSISNRDEAVFESHFAGYISPRRLVKAQIAIAKKNGCQHIQEVVRSVTRVVVNTNRDADSVMEVTTDYGRRILARKVLVATGAFTTFRNLLGVEVSPDTKLFPLAVTKVEISEEDAQKIKYVLGLIYIWNSKYCITRITCIINHISSLQDDAVCALFW